jgi:hypothetical protein
MGIHPAQRPRAWRLLAIAPFALALTIAAPAPAKPSASGTLSSAAASRYVLTVKNTGAEPFEVFAVAASVTNLLPSPPCENRGTSFVCSGTIAPGASKQVCFNATLGAYESSLQVTVGSGGLANEAIFTTSAGPAVSSCPIAGGAGAGTSKWTSAQCRSAYRAWRRHHGRANAQARLKESRKLGKEHHCKLPASALK